MGLAYSAAHDFIGPVEHAHARPDRHPGETRKWRPPPRLRNCRFSTIRSKRSTAGQHGNMKIRRIENAPEMGSSSRGSGHRRRVRASAAPLSDRLLGRRRSGSAGADGPQRGRRTSSSTRTGLPHEPSRSTSRPTCAVIRSCWRAFVRIATSFRSASTRHPVRSASSTNGEPLFDGDRAFGSDQGGPCILRAIRDCRAAHFGLHPGAEEPATC